MRIFLFGHLLVQTSSALVSVDVFFICFGRCSHLSYCLITSNKLIDWYVCSSVLQRHKQKLLQPITLHVMVAWFVTRAKAKIISICSSSCSNSWKMPTSLVPFHQSRRWSQVALAADIALESFLAWMTAAPLCCTVCTTIKYLVTTQDDECWETEYSHHSSSNISVNIIYNLHCSKSKKHRKLKLS